MSHITIEYATIAGARLAVVNNGNRDNKASTLYVSYANEIYRTNYDLDYTKEVGMGGVPISISLMLDTNAENPSWNVIKQFYALDIIEKLGDEDDLPSNPSNIPESNIPTNPSNKTFTWNGNRLSASYKDERYYMNVVVSSNIGDASKNVILMGVPMAQGTADELILHRTSYSASEVEEYKSILIGGSPLTVGRIGNSYYLMVSPILAIDA
jgi:hypothetical protein